jgi:hypothetical protein
MSDDLEELDEILNSSGKGKKKSAGSKNKTVTIEFGDEVEAKDMDATMKMVTKMTVDSAERHKAVSSARADYEKNGGRRYRCTVESLVPGQKFFEMTVSHPKKDRPILIQGKCGVIIEDGLTQYMIDCLTYCHSYRMEPRLNVDPTAQQALTYEEVKVPHFRVTVLNEIQNPKELGRAGSVSAR